MKKVVIMVGVVVSVFFSGIVFADQLAWLSTAGEDAKKIDVALSYLKVGDTIYDYCVPCGDKTAQRVVIKSVTVKSPEENYKEIYINDLGIDLAYVYVKSGKNYNNLGKLAGYAPEQVPDVLPEKLIK